MARDTVFNFKSIEQLKKKLAQLSLNLPISNSINKLKQSLKIGSFELANRMVAQPMEGRDADAKNHGPSPLTVRRYKRIAAGGFSLIWIEATAVHSKGKSSCRQLQLTRQNLSQWKKMISTMRTAAYREWGHEPMIIIQLTHCGRWSKPKPLPAHHNQALPAGFRDKNGTELISDDALDRLQDNFTKAASLAVAAGIDGVDFKAVHGYLTAALLAAHTRPGKYGGSYYNRTRFLREGCKRIKNILKPPHFVTTRLSLQEPFAYPYGWGIKAAAGRMKTDLSEPLKLAQTLTEKAAMPLLNFSLGVPAVFPYLNRPASSNNMPGVEIPEHPLCSIVRFQNMGRQLQQNVKVPVVTAGLAWLQHLGPYVMAGLLDQKWCRLIGQGRQLLAYPDAAGDLISKQTMTAAECCLTCSKCSQLMQQDKAVGCAVRDKKYYRSGAPAGTE
ncbi:MAG TPA: hypothetical protein VKS21_12315 [Spirochaetota bacterium]|nr:hypothetical protein [Spirochaetota bacterium]